MDKPLFRKINYIFNIIYSLILGGMFWLFWVARNTYTITLKNGILYVFIFLLLIFADVFMLLISRSMVVEFLSMCSLFPLHIFSALLLGQSIGNTTLSIVIIVLIFLSYLAVCIVNLIRRSKQSTARAIIPGLTLVQFVPLAIILYIIIGMVMIAPAYNDKVVVEAIQSPDQTHTLYVSELVGGTRDGDKYIEVSSNKTIHAVLFECTSIPQYIDSVQKQELIETYWVDNQTICVNQILYSINE